jgi:membrane-associated phospholipid phosphatase
MKRLQRAFSKMGRGAGALTITVLLFGISSGLAGPREEGDVPANRLGTAFLSRFGRDFAAVLTSPARWDGGDLLTLAAISGGGLLFIAFDGDIQDWSQTQRTASSDKVSSVFTAFGDGAVLLGISAAIYGAGEIGHDDGLRKTALLSLESLATASFIVWMGKFVFGRSRPYSGESSGSFHPFSFKSEHWSLPSGHAAAAFSVATAIAMQAKPVLVDIVAYTLAGLAGVARVHDNKHWASDVFLGSVLGYFIGREIVRLNRPETKKTLSLDISCSGGGQALTLSLRF